MKPSGVYVPLLAAIAAAHPFSADRGLKVDRAVEQFARADGGCIGEAGKPSTWWRAEIGHNGTTPTSSDSSFEYYRTVAQFGADKSGRDDASDAFNKAISDGDRPGNSVTTRPAYVYIPPGKYRIKKSIQLLVSTFLVGDALDPPTLIADPELDTDPVINGYDSHQGDGSATKNFHIALRNVVIDTTGIDSDTEAVALDWSVSQGCSFTNVQINMPTSSKHIGMTMAEGGSGVVISDSIFKGGKVGIQLSNQQYLFKGLTFDGCTTGILVDGTWVSTFQGITFKNCNYGVDMGKSDSAGAISIVDSSVESCAAGVNVFVSGGAGGSLVLDNFQVSDDTIGVKDATGDTLLKGSVPAGTTWILGNEDPEGTQKGKESPIDRPSALLSGDKYFTMAIPQYEEYGTSQVISVIEDPEHKVYGDNSHDDGPAINAILKKYAGCKVVFFPQGIYLTKETIMVPTGSRVVGEVLSTISGDGDDFSNADSPKPIVQVGQAGDKGIAQISDILITTADILPGAVLLQVNMAGNKPGDVGFWNCVMRVGGAVESKVSTDCGGEDPADCKAAFALLHVTSTASAYFEGAWGWVADHGLDADTAAQNIAVGRGALIESTSATWLTGTSFEHCDLYQYNLHEASNVYIAVEQTESPYWQGEGTPRRAPAPWTPNDEFGDPTFSNCEDQEQSDNDQCYRAWGHYMRGSSNIIIHGSAMWVFFNKMNDNAWQDAQCDKTNGICQLNMAFVDNAQSTYWYSLGSKSTTNIVYDASGDGYAVTQENNQGGWGAVVAAYLPNSDNTQ